MKLGLTLPIFDKMADPGLLADLAAEAESAGWDGVFVWDHVYYRDPVRAATDPWISLAAIATATTSVMLGPMVTPLARRRPQIVARQVVALDHLSSGRMVLGVGLGMDASGEEFARFGDESDGHRRAAIFEEALTLLLDLLSGEPVDHNGQYFKATNSQFLPRPVQSQLPIWVAARWPHRRPLDRAARNHGVFVIDLELENLPVVCAHIETRRPTGLTGFDIVVQGPPGTDVRPWEAAGATWWLAAFDPFAVTPALVRAAINQRP